MKNPYNSLINNIFEKCKFFYTKSTYHNSTLLFDFLKELIIKKSI